LAGFDLLAKTLCEMGLGYLSAHCAAICAVDTSGFVEMYQIPPNGLRRNFQRLG
jgi:hypothetical protein